MKKFIAIILLALAGNCVFATDKTIDVVVPPGNNYDKAEFRLWYQDEVTAEGILVLAAAMLMTHFGKVSQNKIISRYWAVALLISSTITWILKNISMPKMAAVKHC